MKYTKTKYPGVYSYKNNTGTKYRVRFFENGNEISKSGFKSLVEAKAYILQYEETKVNDVTLANYWETYREFKVSSNKWNITTEKNSHHKMAPWIEKFGERQLEDITRADVQNYINQLYDEHNYSQETIESYFRMFMSVINDAVEEDILSRNRFKKVNTKKTDWKPTPKTISLEQYNEFMTLAKDNMRKDIYRLLYLITFGLRKSEGYGIKQSNIVFMDNGLTRINIKVARTVNYDGGKNVKSAMSDRLIVVDETAAQYLKEQIEFAKQIKTTHNQILNVDDFIFICPTTAQPLPYKTLNDHIDKITSMMNEPIRITPHMLRHMFATYAAANGVDSLLLKKYLGHASTSMTDHYTAETVEGAEKVMRLVKKTL